MDVAPWVEPDPPEAEQITQLLDTDPEDAELRRTHGLPAIHPEMRSWVPDTIGKAEWAMAKLARAERLIDGLAVERAEFHERIEQWYRAAVAPLGRTVDFFTVALEHYGLAHREATGQATVVLPSGKVATRGPRTEAQRWHVEVADSDAVVAWAEAHKHTDAVKVTKRPLVSVLSKLVTVQPVCTTVRVVMVDGTWSEVAATSVDDVPVCVGEVVDGVIVERLEPVLVPMAVDSAGVPVPGLSVREEQVTATVKPT